VRHFAPYLRQNAANCLLTSFLERAPALAEMFAEKVRAPSRGSRDEEVRYQSCARACTRFSLKMIRAEKNPLDSEKCGKSPVDVFWKNVVFDLNPFPQIARAFVSPPRKTGAILTRIDTCPLPTRRHVHRRVTLEISRGRDRWQVRPFPLRSCAHRRMAISEKHTEATPKTS